MRRYAFMSYADREETERFIRRLQGPRNPVSVGIRYGNPTDRALELTAYVDGSFELTLYGRIVYAGTIDDTVSS